MRKQITKTCEIPSKKMPQPNIKAYMYKHNKNMESDQEDAWPAACTYFDHDLFTTLLLKITIYTYVIRA